MPIDINDRVREVLALAGQWFEDPQPAKLGNVLVTQTRDDVERWLYTEETPGNGDQAEDSLDWLNLREQMAGETLGASYELGLDRAELHAVQTKISQAIWAKLKESLPPDLNEYSNDIHADLVNCAESRLLDLKGPHADFHDLLFRAYQAGVFPCGWEGRYPQGRLAVYISTCGTM